MNGTLTPSCSLGSPQRKLSFRPQCTKAPSKHQHGYALNSEGHTWITKTLHQLHSSTSPRLAGAVSPRHSPLCSICRTPLANPYYNSCVNSRSPVHRRSRPIFKCHSVSPALQTSRGDTGNGPPNDGSGNGGGGSGDGSGNPSGGRHQESPLSETQQVKGLEDVLLLDVQGQL